MEFNTKRQQWLVCLLKWKKILWLIILTQYRRLKTALSKRRRMFCMDPECEVMFPLARRDTLVQGDSAKSIEAAAMYMTNPVTRENAKELLIRAKAQL